MHGTCLELLHRAGIVIVKLLIPINKATLTKIVCLSLVMRSKPAEFLRLHQQAICILMYSTSPPRSDAYETKCTETVRWSPN